MNYYKEIKEQIINNEITKRVKDYSKNRNDLSTYYNVGKLLSEAGKHYGEGIIQKYSKKLTKEVGKDYSERNLRNIRQFYIISQKWQTLSTKLTWSHYVELLWLNNQSKTYYYIKMSIEQNLSVREIKKKNIGQIEVYMNYIDKNIKKPYQDKTIGIIICKKEDKYIMEYCSDKRIISREYELV